MIGDPSVGAGVGAFAAGVLEDLYAAVCGERPVGVRTWCDGDALLVLLRLAGPAPFSRERREQGSALPYEAIPELVSTAVRVQTGCELAAGRWSVEAELGLVMFVFHLPGGARGGPGMGKPRTAVSGLEAGATLARVPSWGTWSPVPRATVRPVREVPAEGRRLRLVEDERESGSVRS
jgi:hypothetical protein